ncbi:MAG TPA: 50S ribosomal protein L11 methyltransferase [Dongiaceae bacterium]|jgi:type II protein arginine methyltransferase|nr:50S ribosomal protein L11 methyltransferase [Dongiaceae bacterium]
MMHNSPLDDVMNGAVETAVRRVDRLMQSGHVLEALEIAKSLNRTAPLDGELASLINDLQRRAIPRWHFSMLNDEGRNNALWRALEAKVTPGSIVLDIGAGSGLLAMMAAKLGAKYVYSCEMVQPIALLARQIVAANGLADRVKIIDKKSSDVMVGRDIPERANLLVTETIDCGLLGEGMLPIISHARQYLLAENSDFIPQRTTLYMALLESKEIHARNHVDRVHGFNVRQFNQFCTVGYFPVRLHACRHRMLSVPRPIFVFDCKRDPLGPETKFLEIPIEKSGTVHGVVFWFDVELADGVHLTNAPPARDSHWMQAVQTFERAIPVERGKILTGGISHDLNQLAFTFHGMQPHHLAPIMLAGRGAAARGGE